MAMTVGELIAQMAVGAVIGIIVVRLVSAPYLIWKADQAEIARLKALLKEDHPA